MGIFNRLTQVVRSNMNALVDRAEDPDSLISQTIREMEGGLKQAKRELVETMAASKRLSTEAETEAAEAERWGQRAALAVKSGDDALARDALKQKLASRRKAEQKRDQARASETVAARMKSTLAELEHKTDELRARKAALASQVRSAREAGGAQPASSLGGGAFGELERLTERVDALESEVEAASVLDDVKKAQLEARFRELEQSSAQSEVEDELAELKRRVEEG
ncbi:MAG: PspA/IM30 family protein [Myxococcales bacterium]|nr:PspA/IM30 family protein [Myxococcales bacterium]